MDNKTALESQLLTRIVEYMNSFIVSGLVNDYMESIDWIK